MLQIAIPNKGALSEKAVELLKEAGYKCSRYGRELIVTDSGNNIDFVFLRPRDIAVYVGKGIIDMGITGRDLAVDSRAEVTEILALNFGMSSFRYA
ncbi:MAG: ATP phosphoribosyltransferase, partial [Victivallaceae bacterium]